MLQTIQTHITFRASSSLWLQFSALLIYFAHSLLLRLKITQNEVMTASLSHSPFTRCGTAALKHNTMKGSSGPILAQQSGESSKVTGIVVKKKKHTHKSHDQNFSFPRSRQAAGTNLGDAAVVCPFKGKYLLSDKVASGVARSRNKWTVLATCRLLLCWCHPDPTAVVRCSEESDVCAPRSRTSAVKPSGVVRVATSDLHLQNKIRWRFAYGK